ncbi:MAG: hypothetical protein ACYC27_18400 [Armatimonadota bacterium]
MSDFPQIDDGSPDNQKALKTLIAVMVMLFLMIAAGSIFFTYAFNPDTSSNPGVEKCSTNIRYLGDAILMYARDNDDRLPSSGWDKKHNKPIWLQSIYIGASKDKINEIEQNLKCYSDTSQLPTSYRLNTSVAGRLLNEIQSKDNSTTAILYEKPTGKYHRWAYYPDGKVRQFDSKKR